MGRGLGFARRAGFISWVGPARLAGYAQWAEATRSHVFTVPGCHLTPPPCHPPAEVVPEPGSRPPGDLLLGCEVAWLDGGSGQPQRAAGRKTEVWGEQRRKGKQVA